QRTAGTPSGSPSAALPRLRRSSRKARPQVVGRVRPLERSMNINRSSALHPSLVDPLIGLVKSTIRSMREPGDPDVFIAAAETVDVSAYGSPQEISYDGSGAGLTDWAATRAAIGECVERFAFGVVHPESLILGSYEEVLARGLNPIAPERWALFDP